MPAAKGDRKLTIYVWLSDEHGNPVGFGPGETVPAQYADKVGDHCFVEPDPELDQAQQAEK